MAREECFGDSVFHTSQFFVNGPTEISLTSAAPITTFAIRPYHKEIAGSVEGIGLRTGEWWQSLFLLCQDVEVKYMNLMSFGLNNDGIDIDGLPTFGRAITSSAVATMASVGMRWMLRPMDSLLSAR